LIVTRKQDSFGVHALSVHYGLLIVKPDIDQFKEGLLSVMSFLMEIQKHQLFVEVFTCAGELLLNICG